MMFRAGFVGRQVPVGVRRGPTGISLDLSLLGPTLDPSITFTRASSATYFDATGTIQTAAINAPRFDNNPVTLASRGLLIEEARTNSIRNSTLVGAATGTPGTLPTNWSNPNTGGLTTNVVAIGTDANGLSYIDVNISGTTGGVWRMAFEISNNIAAIQNQVWAASGYVALIAGSLTGLSVFAAGHLTYTAANALITNHETPVSAPSGSSLVSQKYAVATTASDATTAFVQPTWACNVAAVPVNATLRFSSPQLELGGFATSYIPTSVASVTRALDAASVAVGAWFNAAASSLVIDFMVPQSPNPSASVNRDAGALSDGGTTNRMALRALPASVSAAVLLTVVAGSASFSGTVFNTAANVVQKMGGAWASGSQLGCGNGGATMAGAAAGIPGSISTLTLGNDYPTAPTTSLSGWVRRVRYWPRALSSGELQQATA